MDDLRGKVRRPSIKAISLVVIVLIVCGVFVFALINHNSVKKRADTASSEGQSEINPAIAATKPATDQSDQSESTNAPTNVKSVPGYLIISQWGIKVKLGSANPSIVTYTTMPANECGGTMTGAYTGCVELALKSSVTTIPLCEELGAGIGRMPVKSFNANELEQTSAHIVGKYVYMPIGSPFSCGNQKLDIIREKYTGDNADKWTYSAD